MPSPKLPYVVLRLAIGTLLLTLGLRTWLVMGLIAPVVVAGSSMVPTLRGTHVTADCPDCLSPVKVGAEFAAKTNHVPCPQCKNTQVPLANKTYQPGDRLWIDRATLRWRKPRRWEVVVARNPENGEELCIKRIAGLPGETVFLRKGNLYVDNHLVRKSLEQQRTMRRKIHRENQPTQRWLPAKATDWRIQKNTWIYTTQKKNAVHWLHYQHPHAHPITDDVPYNAGLTRRLNPVHEFMLAAKLRLDGQGAFWLKMHDGTSTLQVGLHLAEGNITLIDGNHPPTTRPLSTTSRRRLEKNQVLLEFSNFDQQLLLAIDGQVELRRPWPALVATGTDQPLSMGAQGVSVQLSQLTLYRDTYHSPHPVGVRPAHKKSWQIGPDHYFLLGDNPPISLDSRRWGPLSGRLLLGRPLAVR